MGEVEGSDRSLWLDLLEDVPKGFFHSSVEDYDLKTLWFTPVPCKGRLQGRDSFSMPRGLDPVHLHTLPNTSIA